jgi:multimeric flavodoxin WrbA
LAHWACRSFSSHSSRIRNKAAKGIYRFMKILLVSSSPRRESSQSFLLAKEVLEGCKASANDVHTETIQLSELKIDFCRHCEDCHRDILHCPIKDDVHIILNSILESDGIILATPNYINQVTASMKALFDRSSHFIHCKRILNKYVAGVVSSGSGNDEGVLNYIKFYANICGAQYSGGVSTREPASKEIMAEAFQLGKRLFSDILEEKVFPEQTKIIEASREHFKRLVCRRKEDWKQEYEYWQNKGWL